MFGDIKCLMILVIVFILIKLSFSTNNTSKYEINICTKNSENNSNDNNCTNNSHQNSTFNEFHKTIQYFETNFHSIVTSNEFYKSLNELNLLSQKCLTSVHTIVSALKTHEELAMNCK